MEVVTAFQRHFRPARVDGIADHSTMSTLHALLASLPADAAPTTGRGDVGVAYHFVLSCDETAVRACAPPNYPTSPFIGFTGALSGNTVSASTRSARPNWSCSTPFMMARRSVVGARSRPW